VVASTSVVIDRRARPGREHVERDRSSCVPNGLDQRLADVHPIALDLGQHHHAAAEVPHRAGRLEQRRERPRPEPAGQLADAPAHDRFELSARPLSLAAVPADVRDARARRRADQRVEAFEPLTHPHRPALDEHHLVRPTTAAETLGERADRDRLGLQ
jgi:hypothetical protein